MALVFDILADLGLGDPVSRTVVGAAIGYFTQALFHPGISWYEGTSGGYIARRWAILPGQTDDGGDSSGTMFPWFMWPLLFGFLFGVLL